MSFITETIARRLNKLSPKCKVYNENPRAIPVEEREDLAMMFGSTFQEFQPFAELGMRFLGFKLSELQADIAEFMQYGHKFRMVQAQRGEAKSTLAALYCVWLLIKNPAYRILIVSAGGKQASDMSLLITRIINQWHLLCWMRPDTTQGDRDSSISFDVHNSLKGVEKSASVSCVGITANYTGFRADFLLADDIEVPTNSATQVMREGLIERTKEFSAICTKGDIMYLGTPQNKDSVYRTLPMRGFDVRIWSGRYPTNTELERYGAGTQLAPYIMKKLLENPELQTGGGVAGDRGQPTDPAHIGEDILCAKELDYGEEGFNLQYMLDTTLADALRTKIRISDIPVVSCDHLNAPETLSWAANPSNAIDAKHLTPATTGFSMYNAVGISDVYVPYITKVMTLDPAGCGGDELSFAAGGATNSYIYLLSVGGYRGGTTEENINKVVMKMLELDIQLLDIERNMGHGTVTALFVSHLDKLKLKCKIKDEELKKELAPLGITLAELDRKLSMMGISDYWVGGQKEKRIIDTISPVTRRHKLVVTKQAIEDDWEHCLQHSPEKRLQYSVFQQLGNITYDRNSLVHDDRADCVQRLVERLSPFLSVDEEAAATKRDEDAAKELIRNPMGYSKRVQSMLGMGKSKKKGRIRR